MRVVFIGGCARSGTTMLAAMLASHPRYCAPQELLMKRALYELAVPDGKIEPEVAIARLSSHLHFRIMIEAIPAAIRRQLPPLMEWKQFLEWIVQQYAAAVDSKRDCTVWIDHSVNNLEEIHFLVDHFPDARFIHIVRDGRAVAASFKAIDWWGPVTVPVAAQWWRENVLMGVFAEYAFPDRVLLVRYEDLVENPTAQLQRICRWASLEYDPSMLEGRGFTVHPLYRHQHRLVGQRLQKEKLRQWQEKLTDREIEIFEAINRSLLIHFGYSLQYPNPKGASRWEWYSYRLQEWYGQLMQRIRRRLRIRRFLG